MTVQCVERWLATRVGDQRVDPRLRGAVGSRKRSGIEPTERHARARTLATGEKLGSELDASCEELVEVRALEESVDAERRFLGGFDRVDRRKHAAKVELEIELCVERRAERTRQIGVLDCLSHATKVHGTSCRAERESVLAPDLVGGSAAPARDERLGEPLGRSRVGWSDFEGAHQVFEGTRAVVLRLATLGGEQIRVRGLLDGNRSGGPRRERRARFRRNGIFGIHCRRFRESVARRSSFTGAREQHADAQKEGRRFLTASCL